MHWSHRPCPSGALRMGPRNFGLSRRTWLPPRASPPTERPPRPGSRRGPTPAGLRAEPTRLLSHGTFPTHPRRVTAPLYRYPAPPPAGPGRTASFDLGLPPRSTAWGRLAPRGSHHLPCSRVRTRVGIWVRIRVWSLEPAC